MQDFQIQEEEVNTIGLVKAFPCLIVNSSSIIKSVNKAFCQISGYLMKDIRRKTLGFIFKKQKSQVDINEALEELSQEHFWTDEWEGMTKKGKLFNAQIRIIPLSSNEDKSKDFMVILNGQ